TPIMSAKNFPKRRARCITGRSSTARSTARPLPIRPKSCMRKESNSTRSPYCPTSATSAAMRRGHRARLWTAMTFPEAPARHRKAPFAVIWPLMRPQQKRDPDHDQHNPGGFAASHRLLEHEAGNCLREQHFDQRQRAHARGGGEGESEEPEL